MSLDTVLKIGNTFRNSKEGIKRHRYINSTQRDVDRWSKTKISGSSVIETFFYQLPVIEKDDIISFDWEQMMRITDEDKMKSLFYLNFKTSDRDSTKKYLFGDIAYAHYFAKVGDTKEKEEGNYQLGAATKVSSFMRGEEVSGSIKDTFIGKFRNAFRKDIDRIEALLKQHNGVVLHFAFGHDENWFEVQGVMDIVNKKLMEEFVLVDQKTKKVSLQKALFKTIAGVTKTDAVGGVTPGLRESNAYKVKAFASVDEVVDLLYAVGISEYIKVRVAKDLGIVVLPNGENLSSEALAKFYSVSASLNEEADDEGDIALENAEEDDSLFASLVNNDFDQSIKFDLIFTKPPGGSTPSVDLLEISSVQKSMLIHVNDKINSVKRILKKQFQSEFPAAKKLISLDLRTSFWKVLSDKTTAEKKYHFHLLKVLPQIYSDTYYQDPVLLPAFVTKVEKNIRNDEQGFSTLKFDFYFLMQLQKSNTLMAITKSKSYALGIFLGTMAEPFAAWRKDCPIKSFEKSYVGNLTRRITNLDDISKFSVFLNEKLVIHEKAYQDQKNAFHNLIETIGNMNERYDKNACALGFFESYYSQHVKEENKPSIEN